MSVIGLKDALSAGDVVADRWRLLTQAPAPAGALRWRAVATDTGEAAEVVLLASGASPHDQRQFVAQHRKLQGLALPSVIRVLALEDTPGRPLVVRAAMDDLSGAGLRGPLPPPLVAAIGAKLAPAVLHAGSVTQGALTPADVALDNHGQPVLAPLVRSLATLPPHETQMIAPERRGASDEATGEAGLYGLGVLLQRLLTGGAHAEEPEDLAQAISLLLHEDPAARAAALPLLDQVAGPVEDLRALTRSTALVGQVITTTEREGLRSAREDDHAAAMVIVPASALGGLDPAARSHAAGVAGVGVRALHSLIERDLPLVLHTARGKAQAQRHLEALQSAPFPVELAGGAGAAPWIVLALTLGLALLPLAIGLGLWVLFSPLWMLVMGAVSGGVTLVGVAVAAAASARSVRGTRPGEALELQRAHQRTRDPRGLMTVAWDRLSALRRELATRLDLPAAAAADIRTALKDLEDQLLALAEGAAISDTTLSAVDVASARQRLARLQDQGVMADAHELARLQRTLADVDEMQAQRSQLLADVQRIEAALRDLTAALGRSHQGALGLESLVSATREAKADQARAAARAQRRERP